MAKKVGNYKIPFDRNGNQLHYPESYWSGNGRVECEMRDNHAFEDTIVFDSMERGRSAAYFYFKRSTGEKLVVFMKDLCDMMPHVINGTVTGTFTFVKRGANFGTALIS
jgi:hypothetical protein